MYSHHTTVIAPLQERKGSMTNNVAPSVVLNTFATFWRLTEKAGMTLQHLQRVIDRPALRRAIVDLIEADMIKLWRPEVNPSYTPTNLDGWTEPFDKLCNRYSDENSDPFKVQLDSLIKELEGKVSSQEIANMVFSEVRGGSLAKMRDPLPFLYHYGLIGDRQITIEELASGFDVSTQTIERRLVKCRKSLRERLTVLFRDNFASRKLLEAGLVSPEWAVSTDDIDILDLSISADEIINKALEDMGISIRIRYSIRRISLLTQLNEAQLRDAQSFFRIQNPDLINEIKTALAKFGLSLAES